MTFSHTTPSISQHLLQKVPIAAPTDSVRDVVAHLTDKRHAYDSIIYIYVLENGTLVGVLSIKELLRAHTNTKLRDLIVKNLVTAHSQTSLEHISIIAISHKIKAVPIVDRKGVFLGVIGTDTILHTLHKKHAEDLLRIGGIQITEQKHILEMLSSRITHLIRVRFVWLFLGLIGGFLTVLIVSRFEKILELKVAFAFFIPAIVYIAAAVGTQTQTIFIRLIAIQKIPLLHYLVREIFVSSILGGLLASMMFIFTAFWTNDIRLAYTVGAAMVFSIIAAGIAAVILPWILMRIKKDPAIGAGPLGTAIQDVLTLLIYFFIASLLI